MEQGVRGSSNATTSNCYFWRYALADRLLMDSSGNVSIGGSSVNSSYKLDINGALNATSLSIGGASMDLSKLSLLTATAGTAAASKALITDSSYGISGIRSLTVSGSTLNKSLVIQNDSTTVAASMNVVSTYQMELGVRPSSSSTTPNCVFLRYALADRLLMDSSGNVNIGGTTVNSSYKLDIAGDLNCSTLYVNGVQPDFGSIGLLSATAGTAEASKALIVDSSIAISNIGNVRIRNNATTALLGTATLNNYELLVERRQGTDDTAFAGIGFIASNSTNYSTYTPSAAICVKRDVGSIASSLIFANRITNNAVGACNERMRITSLGYVSIGTPLSGSQLTVESDGTQLYGAWERTFECWNSKATPMKLGVIMYGENGGTNSNGVSIGTHTNDPLRFMVGGSNVVKINSSSRMGVALSNDSPEATIHSGGQVWANDYMHIKNNANTAMYRWNWPATNYPAIGNEDGSLGRIRIGTCNASYVWQGYSPLYAGSYTNASDERYKKDIEDIPYGLDQVMQMRPRRFAWRDSNELAIGFIAQELLTVCREPVHIPNDPDTLNDQGLPINGYGIDLSSLTAVLVKAIQEQQSQISQLQKTLKALMEE
ncbi:unnamed protein product [Phytophthora lilii]|uniref:Unnamed protein product n=1 Tax=Phytophthora lilii TaxID=2077276 RepID=A0A9W6U3P8_9STRA|nr:unnamed protein product [Phytophthora lilii]